MQEKNRLQHCQIYYKTLSDVCTRARVCDNSLFQNGYVIVYVKIYWQNFFGRSFMCLFMFRFLSLKQFFNESVATLQPWISFMHLCSWRLP